MIYYTVAKLLVFESLDSYLTGLHTDALHCPADCLHCLLPPSPQVSLHHTNLRDTPVRQFCL